MMETPNKTVFFTAASAASALIPVSDDSTAAQAVYSAHKDRMAALVPAAAQTADNRASAAGSKAAVVAAAGSKAAVEWEA